MAAESAQISESTKDCIAKIDRIIEDALGSEGSGAGSRMAMSNVRVDTKGVGDYSPSASPVRKPPGDMSKITFSPLRENYHSISSNLSGITNSESSHKRYELEGKPSTKESFLSNSTKDSRYTGLSDISDNWVNYQFERLVADRKNNPKSKTLNEYNSSTPYVPKIKNVEEILREYGGGISPQAKNYQPSLTSFGISGSRNGNLYKIGTMNRSHNNETLNSGNPEMDQMRRVGSSVDGDVGDVLKSFGAKCSLSGTRCSSSQMLDGEEKSLGLPRDSEVDFKPNPNSSGRMELGEIRADLSGLNYSFQKERERLRHLESLIRKTPTGSSSGPEVIHTLKTHNYSSRFMNDYSGRKAYSITDYSKYGGSDWRSSPPTSDFLARASSSMSYKNLGLYSPTHRSNYMPEYTPAQYTSSGYESGRVPSMTAQRQESHEHDTEPMGHSAYSYGNYPKSSGSSSLAKSKLNRSYNAKKDRNMSKSQTEPQTARRKSSFIKSVIKKPSPTDTRDSRQERQYSDPKMENKSRNKIQSPYSSPISDTCPGDLKRDNRSKHKLSRYQPYQPGVIQQSVIQPSTTHSARYMPERTKSEILTMNSAPWANQFSRFYGSEQSEGESDQQRNAWSTAFCSSDSPPGPEKDSVNEPSVSGNEASDCVQRRTTKSKRVKKHMRSKSECRVHNANVPLWSWQRGGNFPSTSNTGMLQSRSRGPSRAKTTGRKLKPKAKKATSSCAKPKKLTKPK